MRNVPYRLMFLSTWSPAGGAFREGCGTFKRQSLGGGRHHGGRALRVYISGFQPMGSNLFGGDHISNILHVRYLHCDL